MYTDKNSLSKRDKVFNFGSSVGADKHLKISHIPIIYICAQF